LDKQFKDVTRSFGSGSSDPSIEALRQLEKAEALRVRGELDRARTLCEPLVARYPDYYGALYTLGLIYGDKGQAPQALGCLVRAVMLNPRSWKALTALSAVYLDLGAYEMAAQSLEQARQINPREASIFVTLGEIYRAEREYESAYDAYRDAGGNFVDTANLYTNGTSESFLGEFMQGHRDSIVLATKYTNANAGKDANAAGNHRKSMMSAVEASLKRLKSDYIDLYWMHIWDTITPADEVMRGFDDLVHQGKILYAGISDTPAWWISRANTLAELRGWTRFTCG